LRQSDTYSRPPMLSMQAVSETARRSAKSHQLRVQIRLFRS
jgi:hypothetical protein